MRKDQARDWHGRFVKEHKDIEGVFIMVDDQAIDPGCVFSASGPKSNWFWIDASNMFPEPVVDDPIKLTCGDGITYNPDACVITRDDIDAAWDAFDKRHHSEIIVALSIMGLIAIGSLALLVIMAICKAL